VIADYLHLVHVASHLTLARQMTSRKSELLQTTIKVCGNADHTSPFFRDDRRADRDSLPSLGVATRKKVRVLGIPQRLLPYLDPHWRRKRQKKVRERL